MNIDGACHCGRIAYTAVVDPAAIVVCCCTDCQTFSGGAWRASVPAPAATFVMTGEPPSIYVKRAESGRRRVQAFCPDCGTPIYASALSEPEVYNLQLGAIRQRAELVPSKVIWARSALPWSCNISDLPAEPQQ